MTSLTRKPLAYTQVTRTMISTGIAYAEGGAAPKPLVQFFCNSSYVWFAIRFHILNLSVGYFTFLCNVT